ncbi:aspartyl/asparaginyl beta-hydroxylase-like, partial [Babylonia areolata]|uniref:aspartyl/asparaginyl beta-hydroxylase-like n=1 Tax=Babylonia areolata TaxID=304850 RepID=UPI003FD10E31
TYRKTCSETSRKRRKTSSETSRKEEKPAQKPAEKEEKPAQKLAEKEEKPAQKPAEKEEKPAQKPVEKEEKPAQKPVEKEEKPAQKPVEKEEKPAQKPAEKEEKPAQKPAEKEEKPAQKTEEKQDSKPAEKPAQKPVEKEEKPAQKPVEKEEKPAQKPAEKEEKPAQKPVEKEEKPAQKTEEKRDSKSPEKPAPKPTEKEEKATPKPAEKPDSKPAESSDSRKRDEQPDEKQKRKGQEEEGEEEEKEKTPESKDQKPVTPKSTDTAAAADDATKSVKKDDYAKADITNEADYKIRDKLDEADDWLAKGKFEVALNHFDNILRKHPGSPRAQLGRADALDSVASKRRSNEVLEQCILGYERLIYHGEDVMPELMKTAGRRLAKKQQFRGWGSKAAKTMQYLVEQFPEDVSLQREQGVSHLMVGQSEDARRVFQRMLQKNPDDGFAQVHLGFIVKTTDNSLLEAIRLLQSGIDSRQEGTQDGRFYFHLGDALQRLGRAEEARQVYQRGADIGLFLSADQRSLYNVDGLTSRPWWTKEQTGYQQFLQLLQDNWQVIRDEGMQQLDMDSGLFKHEAESLRETGEWKQLTMYQQGHKNKRMCDKVPKTCALIDQISDAKGCKRGQVKFSVMQPGTHVWPHCGPTNCRIRAHLGLVVPQGPRIRVVNDTRTWKEGEFLIFDDSFEHEVWHDGKSVRLVLIVDFWHPDLTQEQKRSLVPI